MPDPNSDIEYLLDDYDSDEDSQKQQSYVDSDEENASEDEISVRKVHY